MTNYEYSRIAVCFAADKRGNLFDGDQHLINIKFIFNFIDEVINKISFRNE